MKESGSAPWQMHVLAGSESESVSEVAVQQGGSPQQSSVS